MENKRTWEKSFGTFITRFDEHRCKIRVYDKNDNYMVGYRLVGNSLEDEYEKIDNIETLDAFLIYFNLESAFVSDSIDDLYNFMLAHNYVITKKEDVLEDNWCFKMGDKYVLLP